MHHRLFMSYQLYYGTQTLVKNAAFCLVKQQSLDPYVPFFLGDVGDDPLEILFGRTRMIGGHNYSACSYAQALDRLDVAKDIDGVFKRHPSLDLCHHRQSSRAMRALITSIGRFGRGISSLADAIFL